MKKTTKALIEGDTILHDRYGFGKVFDIISSKICVIMLYDKSIFTVQTRLIKRSNKKLKILK